MDRALINTPRPLLVDGNLDIILLRRSRAYLGECLRVRAASTPSLNSWQGATRCHPQVLSSQMRNRRDRASGVARRLR
jgi:hypothetical protein